MNQEIIVERLFERLITGDRTGARQIITDTLESGVKAEEIAQCIFWPVLDMISTLFRADQMTTLAHHYATRLLRALIDQTQAKYEQKPNRGRSILMFSSSDGVVLHLPVKVIVMCHPFEESRDE